VSVADYLRIGGFPEYVKQRMDEIQNYVLENRNTSRIWKTATCFILRRQYKDIFYYSGKGECDFVVFHKGNMQTAIQVCYQLNADNLVTYAPS